MSIGAEPACARLYGAEGELVSVRITVEPHCLEQLLDVLARLDFPINPQLYHDAAVIERGPDGTRVIHPATMVEFPAWAGRLTAVREALARAGFSSTCLTAKGMLEAIHAAAEQDTAAPDGPARLAIRRQGGLKAIA